MALIRADTLPLIELRHLSFCQHMGNRCSSFHPLVLIVRQMLIFALFCTLSRLFPANFWKASHFLGKIVGEISPMNSLHVVAIWKSCISQIFYLHFQVTWGSQRVTWYNAIWVDGGRDWDSLVRDKTISAVLDLKGQRIGSRPPQAEMRDRCFQKPRRSKWKNSHKRRVMDKPSPAPWK